MVKKEQPVPKWVNGVIYDKGAIVQIDSEEQK